MEKKIVQVSFDTAPIGGTAKGDKVWGDLLKRIHEWRNYMSAVHAPQSATEQVTTEGQYLVKYFADLTLGDLDWMVELYFLRKLPMDYPSYAVTFTCDFMAKVIDAYRRFKGARCQRLLEEVEKRQQYQASTAAQNLDAMQFMLHRVKQQIDDGSIWVHMVRDVYEYLKRTGQLPLLIADQEERGKEFVIRKMWLYKKTPPGTGQPADLRAILTTPAFTANEISYMQEHFCQEYVVSEFFKTHSLETVFAAMGLDQFQSENTAENE